MDEHVEQATAAPGEKRHVPLTSQRWFTKEIAASLGLADQHEHIKSGVIRFEFGRPVSVELELFAHG